MIALAEPPVTDLESVVHAFDQAAAIVDRVGVPVASNGTWRRLVGPVDPMELAARLAAAISGGGDRSAVIWLGRTRHRVRIVRLKAGGRRHDGKVLVVFRGKQAIDRGPDWGAVRAAYRLTARQTEVGQLVCEGHTTERIAAKLGISGHTARRHVEGLLQRLGVNRRSAVPGRVLGLGGEDSHNSVD